MTARVLLHPAVAALLRSLRPAARWRAALALRGLAADPSGAAAGLDVERVALPCPEPQVRRLTLGPHRFSFVVAGGEVRVFHALPRTSESPWLADGEPRQPGSSGPPPSPPP